MVCIVAFFIGYATSEVPAGINWYEKGLVALHAGNYEEAIRDFTLTIEIFPEDYEALSNRGVAWFHLEIYDRAVEDATRALEVNPYYSVGANQLAWMLATCPDSRYRDGKKAVALAEKVVGRFPEANFLDTLAAAYAEAGNMEAAVQVQRSAVGRLRNEVAVRERESFKKRLKEYGQADAGGPVKKPTATRQAAMASDTIRPVAGRGPSRLEPPSSGLAARDAASPIKDQKTATTVLPTSGAARRFTVHLLSSRQEAWALEKAASFPPEKRPAFVHRTLVANDDTPWFRIYTGAFDTRHAAQEHADTLKRAGHGWANVIPLPAGLNAVSR